MSHRKWKLRIHHILEATERISVYTKGMDFVAFRQDGRTVDAVIRNLQVIGEATRLVPPDVQNRHPQIPWQVMRGLRNVLIHDYVQIKLDVLWDTIQNDLPPLVPLLRRILDQEVEE